MLNFIIIALACSASLSALQSPIITEMEHVALKTYGLIHPEDKRFSDEQLLKIIGEAATPQSIILTTQHLITRGLSEMHAYALALSFDAYARAIGKTDLTLFAPYQEIPSIMNIIEGLCKKAGIDHHDIVVFFAYRWPKTGNAAHGAACCDMGIVLDYWMMLPLSEEEQCSVIAHELGHIVCNHSKRRLEKLTTPATTLDESKQQFNAVTREHEFAADLWAAEMLESAQGIIGFLKKSPRYAPKDTTPSEQWYEEYERYLTHPAPERRIAALEKWEAGRKKAFNS